MRGDTTQSLKMQEKDDTKTLRIWGDPTQKRGNFVQTLEMQGDATKFLNMQGETTKTLKMKGDTIQTLEM